MTEDKKTSDCSVELTCDGGIWECQRADLQKENTALRKENEELRRDKRYFQAELTPESCALCSGIILDGGVCGKCGEDFTPLDAPTYDWMCSANRHWFHSYLEKNKENTAFRKSLLVAVEAFEEILAWENSYAEDTRLKHICNEALATIKAKGEL